MPRFNAPPNWPAPPPGWTPTPDWRPDPAWGPPPPGWELWVPEPGDGRRANRDAFGRVAIVAGVVCFAILLVQVLLGVLSPYNAGVAVGAAFLPWLVVSFIAFFSRRRWGWPLVVGAFVGTWLVLGALRTVGQVTGSA